MFNVPKYRVLLAREGECAWLTLGKVESCAAACATIEPVLRQSFADMPQECLIVLALDNKLRPIGYSEVFRGALASCHANPREIFQFALACNASRIIIAHNHPSGDCTPSPEDIAASRKLADAGDILGVPVLSFLVCAFDDAGKLCYVTV